MTEIVSKQKCTGCAACQNICKKNAITLYPDEKGFLYPEIDRMKCVDCKKCVKICPANRVVDISENQILYTYAFRHSENSVLMDSTSGGAFTAISDVILLKQGVVYAAMFDKNLTLVHAKASDKKTRDKFRGAKYIQSKIGLTYREIEDDLHKGKKVLFVGTPCQIDGLHSYLKKDYENLYMADIVCHGVPSPKVWKGFVDYLSKRIGKIIFFSFRYKPNGWHGTKIYIETSSKNIFYNTPLTRSFSDIYFKKYSIRESCKHCKYKCEQRVGDITIGDFWRYDDYNTMYKDEKGVSLILVNTGHGCELIHEIKKEGKLTDADLKIIPQSNINKKDDEYPIDEEKFWNDFLAYGYGYVAKKYTEYGLINNLKDKLLTVIKDIIKIGN